jgi:hypothetical protein
LVDRSKRPLQGADLAEDRLRLDRPLLNGAPPLSSPVGRAAIPRGNKKVSCRRPALRWALPGEPSVASGPLIAIEAAMARARKHLIKENHNGNHRHLQKVRHRIHR